MEHATSLPFGFRQSNLKKSFELGIRSILTACSKEEFNKTFSSFNHAERESLHRLFIEVIASLHANIEEEFESICQETQVGNILDKIEELVEEQSLDILLADKTNLADAKEEVSRAKKNEIQHLKNMLEMAVEQNNITRARVESLKKERQDLSVTSNAIEKFRSWNLNYAQMS